jgi:hypothetical protein
LEEPLFKRTFLFQQLKMTFPITSQKIQEELLRIIAFVKKRDVERVFCDPVDVVALGLHDYHTIVTNPMDLSTVEVCDAYHFR